MFKKRFPSTARLSLADLNTISARRFVRGALALGALGLIGFLLFVIWIYPPTENSLYPKCHLHSLTGLHCPGCGLTRSVSSLLHGELTQALAYNPMFPVILPLLAWGMGSSLWNAGFPGRAVHIRLPRRPRNVSLAVLIAAMVAFFILRNIPAYPFNLLAPHELTP